MVNKIFIPKILMNTRDFASVRLPILCMAYTQNVGVCGGLRMKCEFIRFWEYF
jgi:hypothetical protein